MCLSGRPLGRLDELGGDEGALEILRGAHRRIFRNGDDPTGRVCGRFRVTQLGHLDDVAAVLHHPVAAADAEIYDAVLHVPRDLLRAEEHHGDVFVVGGWEIVTIFDLDTHARAGEELLGGFLEGTLREAETNNLLGARVVRQAAGHGVVRAHGGDDGVPIVAWGPMFGGFLVIGRVRAADAENCAGGDPGAARGTRVPAREKGADGHLTTDAGGRRAVGFGDARSAGAYALARRRKRRSIERGEHLFGRFRRERAGSCRRRRDPSAHVVSTTVSGLHKKRTQLRRIISGLGSRCPDHERCLPCHVKISQLRRLV